MNITIVEMDYVVGFDFKLLYCFFGPTSKFRKYSIKYSIFIICSSEEHVETRKVLRRVPWIRQRVSDDSVLRKDCQHTDVKMC